MASKKSSKDGELRFAIEQFAAQYPGSKWGQANAGAYFMRLQFFGLDDVRGGLEDAARENRRWIPDLTTVAEYVVKRERRRKLEAQLGDQDLPLDAPPDRGHVPTDPDEAAQYIAGAPNRFEACARQCEVESVAMRLPWNKPTPKELGQKRSREMQRLLGHAMEGKEIT